MGVLEWRFNAENRSLESENGTFQFTIVGDTMDGTLSLPDKSVYRRIHLKRELKAGAAATRFDPGRAPLATTLRRNRVSGPFTRRSFSP